MSYANKHRPSALYAGAILFRGPAGTRFGRTEDQGRFFLELKHGF